MVNRLKKIIYKKILDKDNSVEYDSVASGINEYIVLNGLDVVNEKLNDEMIEKYISAFWTPLESFSGQMLVEYFKNFAAISKFKLLSNSVFEQAKNKLYGKEVGSELAKKSFDELVVLYSELYKNMTMHEVLDNHLSECEMDLAYICDNSKKTSIRIGELIKRN